jgi:hypothetical protein
VGIARFDLAATLSAAHSEKVANNTAYPFYQIFLRYSRQNGARLCSAAVLLEESERKEYSTVVTNRDAFYL